MGQPGQTQAGGQAAEHRTPRLLGGSRGGIRGGGTLGLRRCGGIVARRLRRRGLPLGHITGLLAHGLATSHALGIGIEVHKCQQYHQDH